MEHRVAVGEHSAVGGDEPVPTAARRGCHADDGCAEMQRTRRAMELGAAKIEDTTIGSDEPVPRGHCSCRHGPCRSECRPANPGAAKDQDVSAATTNTLRPRVRILLGNCSTLGESGTLDPPASLQHLETYATTDGNISTVCDGTVVQCCVSGDIAGGMSR